MTMKNKWGFGALFAMAAFAVAQLASAADVTGTWIMAVETGAGSGSPTFVLVQKGDALTGSYKGQLGEAQVTGTVTGNDVVIEYKVDAQGQVLAVKYTGKVDGNSMSGKVSLGQLGEGTFKGTKQ
ncbi:MAG TPA: hypothetical protein VNY80_09680 [Steroidobacteraceae bacterium]|jgi:hypothetical protein|nr:hypothetical protein [Steroidobacteraceae bacterium]